MTHIDEKLEPILAEVLRRNAGETEFHQAVREVLESLGRVIAKHPDYAGDAIIDDFIEVAVAGEIAARPRPRS